MDNIELRCIECNRFLRVRPKATIITTVLCSNSKCRKENNVKVVTPQSSEKDIRYKFA